MKHVAVFFVRIYQKIISPLFPPCCRFTPSCSAYAVEAFQTRGFFIGLGLSVWRILRCNPFCRPGYDPVPLPRKAIFRKIPKYDRVIQERERWKRK